MVESPGELFLSLLETLDQDYMEKAMMVCWAIWRVRNELVWSDKTLIMSRIVETAMVFFEGMETTMCATWKGRTIRWLQKLARPTNRFHKN